MTDHKIRRFSAGDVLDQRSDLVDHIVGAGNSTLLAGSKFRDLIVGTLAGSMTMRNPQTGLPRSKRAFAEVPGLIHVHLQVGEVYRVSADMTELITHAAALLDDTDQWSTDLLPTEAGFVRFDKPLVLTDARGNDMLIHAMTWGPANLAGPNGEVIQEEATFVSMWNDMDVEADHYLAQMIEEHGTFLRKVAGRWSFIGAEVLVNGQRMGPALIDPSVLGVTDTAVSTPFTNNHRLIMAMCMLMDQTIVDTTERERPNIHARRRAKERKLSQPDITVVTLRRRSVSHAETTPGESGREWHHRWVVRGHWRWARVGEGRRHVRRVWVEGHVKGPEDKPLKITQKVYDLKR